MNNASRWNHEIPYKTSAGCLLRWIWLYCLLKWVSMSQNVLSVLFFYAFNDHLWTNVSHSAHPITASPRRLTVNLPVLVSLCGQSASYCQLDVTRLCKEREDTGCLLRGTCRCYLVSCVKWCLSSCFESLKMATLELYSKVRLGLTWGLCNDLLLFMESAISRCLE